MRNEGTGMENGTGSGGRAYRVSPAGVRSNDWQSLEVADLDSLSPAHFVTVVIPYYERPDALELTLAGLERQTYPRDQFEVVVVDDGGTDAGASVVEVVVAGTGATWVVAVDEAETETGSVVVVVE